ncbi:MAG: hypothetical protein RSA01_02450 [Clostridium sp.]
MKVYVDGSYMRRVKNISISYCIVDKNKNVLDEFGLSVGYSDYSDYVNKYGNKFVGLLAMCKTIDKLYKNRDIYSGEKIEISTQNSFVVYVLRVMKNSREILSFMKQWYELYPFLEFIRKRMKYINIVTIDKLSTSVSSIKGSEDELNNKSVFQVVMPPIRMRCTS